MIYKKSVKILLAGILIMAFQACSVELTNSDSQRWIGTVTSSESTCKHIGKDIEGTYDLLVDLGENDTILLSVVKSGNVFKGLQSTVDTNLYVFTASYREDGGVLSEKMEITVTEPGKGMGHSVWSWSDGINFCEGEFEVTLERKDE